MHGAGKRYEEIEPELRRDYERNYATSRLKWESARPAVRAAWRRFDRELDRYIGYDVVDRNSNSIGKLECLWEDHTGEPAFVGVRTGWLLGKTHVVPSASVDVNESGRRIRLPYTEEKVKNAPAYESNAEMSDEKEREIYRYYGMTESSSAGTTSSSVMPKASERAQSSAGTPGLTSKATTGTAGRMGQPAEESNLQLAEEQLRISKRDVEAGGVRLRKIVRTETVNQPVELRREEIVVERVPAGQATRTEAHAFEEQEIYIPLRREEAIVQKEVRVREEVRARKESQTDTQQVSESVRREDVDIQRTGEARDREVPPRKNR